MSDRTTKGLNECAELDFENAVGPNYISSRHTSLYDVQ